MLKYLVGVISKQRVAADTRKTPAKKRTLNFSTLYILKD